MNFILGVGAQKCGTTWLAKYLLSHPQAFFSPYKELHVFDAMFAPDLSGFSPERRFEDLLRIPLNKIMKGEQCSRQELGLAIERYSLSLGEKAYLAYFKRYARPHHRALGEITPSYSLIPQQGFRFIRNMMTRAHLNPRVIFIMRDPADRLYSQLKFNQALGLAKVQDAYASALSDPTIVMRSRYDLTLANLLCEFKQDEVMVLFYEELFSDASVKAICEFLDIEFRPADFSDRQNSSQDTDPIDPVFEKAARETLDIVYRFCADRFGQEKIRSLWKHY